MLFVFLSLVTKENPKILNDKKNEKNQVSFLNMRK